MGAVSADRAAISTWMLLQRYTGRGVASRKGAAIGAGDPWESFELMFFREAHSRFSQFVGADIINGIKAVRR